MATSLTDVLSISAAEDGSVWAVTKEEKILKYDATADKWEPIPGSLVDIAVGSAANIWGVNSLGQIWRYSGSTNTWEPITGELVQITASSDGQAWGVNSNGEIFQYVGGTQVWQRIAAPTASYVSVGSVNNIWCLDTKMGIWWYTGVGDIPWNQALGLLTQISTIGHQGVGDQEYTVDTWGVNADGVLFRFNPSEPDQWERFGGPFKQIAVGSVSNAWAIDQNDVGICLTSPRHGDLIGGEPWVESQQKRWDSKDKFDQTQSTHLWIVSRAAEVAFNEPHFGRLIYNLVKPGAAAGESQFHDGICEGLWDADEADPYRNSIAPGDENYGQILATYKSHFFDPETGLNWLGQDTPTAVTEGPKFFKMALDEYNNGNIHAAGYFLGLSLHYLTDMSQPMHAANFTYLSPPLAYHQAFEGWAIKVMQDVQITQEYTPSNLGSDPYNYIFALAQQSRPRNKRICSFKNLTAYACPLCAYSHSWYDDVIPEIQGALQDGVAITAQYLIEWMKAARPTIPKDDPRQFIKAYSIPKANYWAVDSDSHLFRRKGTDNGWTLITTPSKHPLLSLYLEEEGGVYVVSTTEVWYFTSDEKWILAYPPPLVNKDEIVLQIKQLIVLNRVELWALDASGHAFQGRGSLPNVQWTDSNSPELTSLAASSIESAWGVNSKDSAAWQYASGRWQTRGVGMAQVSVDPDGNPWGISVDGTIVTYDGRSWDTPPNFSDTRTPGWGELVWIDTRTAPLVIDQSGTAWTPYPVQLDTSPTWMPLN